MITPATWSTRNAASTNDCWAEKRVCTSHRVSIFHRRQGNDMTALSGWENFYVIVGSSAGALIGLQFVVIALIADMPIVRGQAQAGAAFATPTIVHF